jgi:hypothetical protein
MTKLQMFYVRKWGTENPREVVEQRITTAVTEY